MTNARKEELQKIVGDLNNHVANMNVDHLTFTAFFNTEIEFKNHIEKLERNIANYKGK